MNFQLGLTNLKHGVMNHDLKRTKLFQIFIGSSLASFFFFFFTSRIFIYMYTREHDLFLKLAYLSSKSNKLWRR